MRLKRILILCAVVAALAAAHLLSSAMYERPRTFERPSELDRQDCRVGVLSGYDSEKVSRCAFPRAQIVGFSEFDDAFTALLAGRIEAFVYSEHVLNVGLRAYPDRFKMLEEPLARAPAVALVSPKRADLLPKLNRFIANYRKLGIYDSMFVRWCQSDAYVPMPAIPEPDGSRGELRIGTSGTEEPSSFVDDSGTLTGFDIEFARRFAQTVHLKPVFVCRPDGAILGELASGMLDLVVDDYTAGEADGGLLVSDGYFDSDIRVLVRRGDDDGLMLGSTRLGYSRRIIRDPRVALFVSGFLTTLSLTYLSALLGAVLAWLVRRIEGRAPRFVQAAVSEVIGVIRLLPPPVVILMVSCAILTSASAWAIAVAAFALWFAAFLEPVASPYPVTWLPVVRIKLVELMQWTSVVGSVCVCDLTMAADLVCGRSIRAFGPLLSVCAAYYMMNWIVVRTADFLERKLK